MNKQWTAPMFDMFCYLVLAAGEVVGSPPEFGAARMLEASSKLVEMFENEGYQDEFAARLKEIIDRDRLDARESRDKMKKFIDDLGVELARELKRRRQ